MTSKDKEYLLGKLELLNEHLCEAQQELAKVKTDDLNLYWAREIAKDVTEAITNMKGV